MVMHYYVDIRPHHKHQVHREGCTIIPSIQYLQYLGMFETSDKAVAMARVVYEHATSCKKCAKPHTTKKTT